MSALLDYAEHLRAGGSARSPRGRRLRRRVSYAHLAVMEAELEHERGEDSGWREARATAAAGRAQRPRERRGRVSRSARPRLGNHPGAPSWAGDYVQTRASGGWHFHSCVICREPLAVAGERGQGTHPTCAADSTPREVRALLKAARAHDRALYQQHRSTLQAKAA